jgi:glyoxylase-like metal-dependent hydrolase (beta-lactamase superfamily II)/ferredoxin
VALLARRLPENVDGEFFVDDSCIDCDACRQIAPDTFRDHGGQSSVFEQPSTPGETHRALLALVACPTASIGTVSRLNASAAARAFPIPVRDQVFFCGYTSEDSFGAWAYLIARPAERGGNVLVDSPRFAAPLVRRLEEMGGIRLMFLTHRDDIADHAKFAAHFACPRVMHEEDGARRLGIERVITGREAYVVAEGLEGIPTPGHTRGHQVLHDARGILFTGDHLAWSAERRTLTAFREACWFSWTEQIRSMERLRAYRFESVLPGHGRIHHAPADEMHRHLDACVAWMKRV